MQTLLKLKIQSRRPTGTAYHAVLRCVTEYTLRRGGGSGRSGTAGESNEDGVDFRPEGVGWHLAMAALRDAEAGGVDLGVEGFEQLMRVCHPYD